MSTPIEILYVEDNPGDVDLVQEALRGVKVLNRLHIARDGEEALAFLRRKGPFSEKPRPDLILLDLNLPKRGGLEVLSEIKQDPDLKRIPVVILSSSGDVKDVTKGYALHANCYVMKSAELDGFLDVVRQIEGFWLEVVKLPRKEGA